MDPYTFYPVRWDTQKGDILPVFWGVCGKSVPLGGGHFFVFGVCASHEKCPTKKKGGGTLFQKGYDFFSGSAQVFLAVAT